MFEIVKKPNRFYSRHADFVHMFLICLSILLVFWRLPWFGFMIGWDDQWFVLNHYSREGFTAKNLYLIISDFYSGQYAPLNQLYYTTIHYIFGNNAMSFHIGSIIIHMVNCVLFYRLAIVCSDKLFDVSSTRRKQIAFFTSFLIAVSPINLEPVAWVAAAKVLLYAMFYLMAVLSYCRYIETGKHWWYYGVLLFFVLSFGAKEQAVTFPICMILIDYLYSRSLKQVNVLLEKVPIFILGILFGLATLQSQAAFYDTQAPFYPYHHRIILGIYTLDEYIVKTLIPVNLSYLYPYPFQVGRPAPLWMWCYSLILPVVIWLTYRQIWKRKWISFCLMFTVIHLLMVLNIFSIARFSLIADRYAYISTFGIYFICARVLVGELSKGAFRKRTALIFGGIYMLYFMIYTNVHSQVWTDAATLKRKVKTIIQTRSDYKIWKQKPSE